MSSPRVLAVDSGAGHVSCGLVSTDKSGRITLERFALETFNPDAAIEAEWGQLFGQSLAEVIRREKMSGPVSLSLPGHQTLAKFIKTPAVEKSKRQKIIHFEAQQNIPYSLDEVVWDDLTVSDDGLDLEIMLAAAKLDIVEESCGAVGSAGLSVQQVTPSSLAVLRCFRYNYPDLDESVLLVDIGARSTNLIFVEKQRFFIRTIQLAGNTVTQAIAEEIKQDFAHSESLKIQVLSGVSELPPSSPARASVATACQSFIGKLHLEITRSTVNYRRQSGAEQPVAVYLTGGGSLVPNLDSQLGERLKMRIERLDPLREVSVAGAASGARDCLALLPALIGLAIPVSEDQTLSLLPPAISNKLAFHKREPLLITAAALIALAFVPPLIQSQRLLGAINDQTSAVESEILPLQSVKDRISNNLVKVEETNRQITGIRDLVESKSNWINFMTDLQQRLSEVGDVWLDQMQVLRPAASTSAPGAGMFAEGEPMEVPLADAQPQAEVIRLQVSGRLLDINNPMSKVSRDSYDRVRTLLESFVGSQFISDVERESFNADTPGILRFDFVLVVDPQRRL